MHCLYKRLKDLNGRNKVWLVKHRLICKKYVLIETDAYTIKILKNLENSENMVKIVKFIDNFVLVKYYAEGDLMNYIMKRNVLFSENEARALLLQMINIMTYLEECGIVHGDIRLENILVQEKNGKNIYKLCDFGSAAYKQDINNDLIMVGRTTTSSNCASPELIRGGVHCDIWSLGILLYNILVGKEPFTEEHFIEFENPEMPDYLSTEVVDLIYKLLDKYQQNRPNLIEILNHPFLNPNSKQLVSREPQKFKKRI